MTQFLIKRGKLWWKLSTLRVALCTCCIIDIRDTAKEKKHLHFYTEHLCCWQNNKSQPWHSTGNAGFRLHFPAHFELVGDLEARRQESEEEQNGMQQLPRQPPVARSVEACIGQKLQLIGDQFHREHLQLVRRKHASCWLYKLKTDALASGLMAVNKCNNTPSQKQNLPLVPFMKCCVWPILV